MAKKQLNEMIDEVIVKKNIRYPINVISLRFLSNDIIKKSQEILKQEIKSSHIVTNQKAIQHIRPERKETYNQTLRVDEMKQIVDILDDINTPILVDTKNKNIIFLFDDVKNEEKINKIVIHLNYELKKFGLTNYMVTVGKVNKKSELGKKEYIQVR